MKRNSERGEDEEGKKVRNRLERFTKMTLQNERGMFIENPLFGMDASPANDGTTETNEKRGNAVKDNVLSKKYDVYIYIARSIIFLVIPLVVIWTVIEKPFLFDHLVFLTYVQMIYCVIIPFSIVKEFSMIKTHTRLIKIVIFLCLVYIICYTVVLSIPEKPAKAKIDKKIKDEVNSIYGECEFIEADDTFPKHFCPSLFTKNVDRALVIGRMGNGTRLSVNQIKKAMNIINDFVPLLTGDFPSCTNLLRTLLCRGLISKCSSQCRESKISTSFCHNKFSNDCIQKFAQVAEEYTEISLMEKINNLEIRLSMFTLLANEQYDRMIKFFILSDIKEFYLSFHASGTNRIKTKASFCGLPYFFSNTTTVGLFSSCSSRSKDVVKELGKPSATLLKEDIWKICNTVICIVSFIMIPFYKTSVTVKKKGYNFFENSQLCFCTIFLILLLLRLVFTILAIETFEDIENHKTHKAIVVHMFAFFLASLSFMLIQTIMKFTGKKKMAVFKTNTNMFVNYYNVFEELTDIGDGKYYFRYMIVLEIFEIILQFITFDTMVRENDLTYVIVACIIIALNLVVNQRMAQHHLKQEKNRG